MPSEHCAICTSAVPFDAAVHVMYNDSEADGVTDHYVCRDCFEADLVALFE